MNILITSGGTMERIDAVRGITNTSTGRLGSLTAETMASRQETQKIYYVCSPKAVLPDSKKAEIFYAEDVADLERNVREILRREKIDIIVHSMAVSDYRVRSVTSAAMLADTAGTLIENLTNGDNNNGQSCIAQWIGTGTSLIGENGKISSNVDNMVLLMERTPKIISLYQELSPESVLVGFKLLDHVSLETLLDAANHVLLENKCSFVLANDLSEITLERHVGYLVNKSGQYVRYETKEDIAKAIAEETIQERSGRI